ncbi:hypothetical protein ACFZAT_26130 [Streptomyces sp. NPDC008163]|uniref:hypothetical protein n=1 Tax=Streptomyces sp. NPDC008163 TaxID=3364818 RepID=UPI0036EAFCDD
MPRPAVEARALALAVRDRLPADTPGAVAVGTVDGALVLALNKAAHGAGMNAAQLVKQLLGGRGGGSAEVAQGGGLGPAGVSGALAGLPAVINA